MKNYEVRITTRDAIVGDKLYGYMGVYIVPEDIARYLHECEKCEVLSQVESIDDGIKVTPFVIQPSSTSNPFIEQFTTNIEGIMGILIIELVNRGLIAPPTHPVIDEVLSTPDSPDAGGSLEDSVSDVHNNEQENSIATVPEIPEGFPERDTLINNGVKTIEQLKALTQDDLTAFGLSARKVSLVALRISEM